MYYELYIDVFFVVNAWIDFLVLSVTRGLLRPEGGLGRRVMASLLGAFLLCLYFATELRFSLFGSVFAYLVICMVMVRVAFHPASGMDFLRTWGCFYAVSLFLNGVFSQIADGIQGVGVLIVTVALFHVLAGILLAVGRRWEAKEKPLFQVRIFLGGSVVELMGIWDTGNCLTSPYGGRGISIVEYEALEQYLSEGIRRTIRCLDGEALPEGEVPDGDVFFVPYKTIEGGGRLLPVIRTEKMMVRGAGRGREYDGALVGLIQGSLSDQGEYRAILSTKS